MKSVKKLAASVKARIEAAKSDGDNPPWVKQVAMLTGVLAAVSGFLAVRATTLTNDAIYESNQAILAQAESSDNWGEYQAESIKAHIVETQLTAATDINPDAYAKLSKEAEELRSQQPALKETALDKAKERDSHLHVGLKQLAEKDLLGYAGLAAQLGIALASVAALVRLKLAFHAGILMGTIGIAILAYAYAVHFGVMP